MTITRGVRFNLVYCYLVRHEIFPRIRDLWPSIKIGPLASSEEMRSHQYLKLLSAIFRFMHDAKVPISAKYAFGTFGEI